MTKITIDRATVEQALEALEVATTPLAKDRQEVLRAQAAIKEALAEPAQQDGETIVQTFTGLPKRKLSELLAAGWQINGVCFQRTEEDGTVRRGAATTGGMVLWWNAEQPAQQEPVIDKSAATRIATTLGWEPKREWVGLTDDEIIEALNGVSFNDLTGFTIARAIEAKLKEKNT